MVELSYEQVRQAIIADAGPHERYVEGLPTFEQFVSNAVLPQDPLNEFTIAETIELTT